MIIRHFGNRVIIQYHFNGIEPEWEFCNGKELPSTVETPDFFRTFNSVIY